MKKLFFSSALLLIFFSCSEEINSGNLDLESFDISEDTRQLIYNINGENLIVDVAYLEGDFSFIQNDNFLKVSELLNSDGLITYIDSNDVPPLYFTSIEEYERYSGDDKRQIARRKELGRPLEPTLSKKGFSGKNTPSFHMGRNTSIEVSIPVNTRYSNRHLGFNKCITGGIGFQDNITSISVDYGLKARFYSRDDYRGSVLVLDATEAVGGVGHHNLSKIRKRNAIVIDSQSDWSHHFKTWLSSDWNDKITSVSVVKKGLNEFTNRNTRNVCGGGGPGAGGGGEGPNPL